MVIYTTAPSDYDWHYVRVIDENYATNKSNGKTIRLLDIPADRVDTQCGRYGSGLHLAVDDLEFQKLLAYDFVTLTPKGDGPVPARLDAAGTAVPMTRLLGHGRLGDCQGPGITNADTLEETATGKRTSLT